MSVGEGYTREVTAVFDFTLSDLFDSCSDGMMTVALDTSGGAIHINEVPSGLDCHCLCPACNRPLVARKGKVLSHHFAHQKGQFDRECAHAGETILHRWAKEVLSKHLMIGFPAIIGEDEFGPLVVHPKRLIRFERVELEKRVGSVIPDVIGHIGGRQLFIEIKVTHGCSPEKLQKLSVLDVGVIEVDLSGYRDHKLRDLEHVVIDLGPRQVLQAKALDDIEPALNRRREERTSAFPQEASALIDMLKSRKRRLVNEHKFTTFFKDDPKEFVMDERIEDLSFFDVPDQEWKAWIISVFQRSPCAHFGAADLVKILRRKRWIAQEADTTCPMLLEYIRTASKLRVFSPEDHIHRFLHHIFGRGLLLQPHLNVFKFRSARSANLLPDEGALSETIIEHRLEQIRRPIFSIFGLASQHDKVSMDVDWFILRTFFHGCMRTLHAMPAATFEQVVQSVAALHATLLSRQAPDDLETFGLPIGNFLRFLRGNQDADRQMSLL